ncbi:uncharacterized protein K441DRAFT_653399 [Cenococcum geophilum 1.58]|uniref:uncharacterized protein n=1 Tax=Cenococcum geophilum 1.58 TaxID=794803 RepID=UPI00358E8A61|nr:hypothetical protein K441DRAFT_653399 [Cenococcum geophilum 1.58]
MKGELPYFLYPLPFYPALLLTPLPFLLPPTPPLSLLLLKHYLTPLSHTTPN